MNNTDSFMEWMKQQPYSVQYHFRGLIVSALVTGFIFGVVLAAIIARIFS